MLPACMFGIEPRLIPKTEQMPEPPSLENSADKDRILSAIEAKGRLHKGFTYHPEVHIPEPANFNAYISHIRELAEDVDGASLLCACQLIPPSQRWLYGYTPDDDLDCHASAFAYNGIFEGSRGVKKVLDTFYIPIEPPQNIRFGDHILLSARLEDDFGLGMLVEGHSCIYIARGLVFSKNGGGVHAPFLLQPFEQVRKAYTSANAYLDDDLKWDFRLTSLTLSVHRPKHY